MSDIKLFAISTDDLRITKLGFDHDDQPFTKQGYFVVSNFLTKAGGSTSRFRSVGASDGTRTVDVTALLGATWDQTEANVRKALAHA